VEVTDLCNNEFELINTATLEPEYIYSQVSIDGRNGSYPYSTAIFTAGNFIHRVLTAKLAPIQNSPIWGVDVLQPATRAEANKGKSFEY
jgi:hypothetical protein